MPDGNPLTLGNQGNTSSAETRITRSGASGTPAFRVLDQSGTGAIVGHADSRPGVWGGSETHNGVVGTSRSGNGVWGSASGNGRAGVFGEAGSEFAYGVVAASSFRNTWALRVSGAPGAAFFQGDVAISGHLSVHGAKSAAVAHPDGSQRLLYALESPESWFEDFGRARMSQGRASVELDPDFAALVLTDDYHVFLTPEGDSNGLYVSGRSEDGFEVREQQGGTSDLAFTYRVVAKRKDIEAERLQRVEEEASPPPPPTSPELLEGMPSPSSG